ncbi:MAG: hypothetical protein ACLFN4_04100, partial [Candidatus Acetothermia bacterium]
MAVGASWGFVNVSNLVIISKLSEGRFKGQIFGLYNGVIGASFVAGSLVGGYLATLSTNATTFLVASLFIALGLAIIRWIAST